MSRHIHAAAARPKLAEPFFAMQKHRAKRKSISGKPLFSKLILAFCQITVRGKKWYLGQGRLRVSFPAQKIQFF